MLKSFANLCAGALLTLIVSACGGTVNVASTSCDCNEAAAPGATAPAAQTSQAAPSTLDLHCAP